MRIGIIGIDVGFSFLTRDKKITPIENLPVVEPSVKQDNTSVNLIIDESIKIQN